MSTTTQDQHALASGRAFPWHEVYCPNAQGAIDFYTQALGMGTQEYPMGDTGTYHMLTVNGTAVAGIMETSTPEMSHIPAHWAAYHAVDDVDARIAKCVQLGATVVVPAMDIPKVGRMALIADPQGAHLWLFKGAPEE